MNLNKFITIYKAFILKHGECSGTYDERREWYKKLMEALKKVYA